MLIIRFVRYIWKRKTRLTFWAMLFCTIFTENFDVGEFSDLYLFFFRLIKYHNYYFLDPRKILFLGWKIV